MVHLPIVLNEVLHLVHALVHLTHALLEALVEAVGVQRSTTLTHVPIQVRGVAGPVPNVPQYIPV